MSGRSDFGALEIELIMKRERERGRGRGGWIEKVPFQINYRDKDRERGGGMRDGLKK